MVEVPDTSIGHPALSFLDLTSASVSRMALTCSSVITMCWLPDSARLIVLQGTSHDFLVIDHRQLQVLSRVELIVGHTQKQDLHVARCDWAPSGECALSQANAVPCSPSNTCLRM